MRRESSTNANARVLCRWLAYGESSSRDEMRREERRTERPSERLAAVRIATETIEWTRE